MVVICLRHGKHEYSAGRIDPMLAIEGVRQAHVTARALTMEGITHVFASPFRRATETAGFICEVLGLVAESQPMLSETIGDGMRDFTGFSRAELERFYPFLTFPDDFPAGKWWPEWPETYADVKHRLAGWVKELRRRFAHTDAVVLNVCHGGSCNALLDNFVSDFTPEPAWVHDYCGYSRVTVGPGGVGHLDYLNRVVYARREGVI